MPKRKIDKDFIDSLLSEPYFFEKFESMQDEMKTKREELRKQMLGEVDFVVKTFKRYDCLDNLLKSILKYYPEAKITIADDNEEIDSQFYAKWKGKLDVELLRMPFDSGLSAGRNNLVRSTKRKYIFLLDDDFIFTSQTRLEKFYNFMEEKKEAGVIGGCCIENKRDLHYEYLISIKNGVFTQLPDGNNFEVIAGTTVKKTDSVLNFALFRRQLFEDVLWDPELKVAEHANFYARLKKTNWEVYYTPEVKVIHDKQRPGDYGDYRSRSDHFLALSFQKLRITKHVALSGTVCELINGKIVKSKIKIYDNHKQTDQGSKEPV